MYRDSNVNWFYEGGHMMYSWFRIIFIILSVLVISVSSTASTLIVPQETLVIGSISTKPSKSFKRLTLLSQYLQEKLAKDGIKQVKIKVAQDIEQMQAFINAGEIDLFSETMFTAIKLENIDIDLLRWKKGVAQYQTLFITQKSSDIYSINDLIGKSIALEDPGSTSGYLIPMLEMTIITDKVSKKETIQDDNASKSINYIFSTEAYSSSIDNLTMWTHRGIVDAAAISDIDWADKRRFPEKLKKDLRVFSRSDKIPRSLVMSRSTLDKELKQALIQALLEASNNKNGQQALEKFTKTKKFTLLTALEKQNIENTREVYNQKIRLVE
jgi:phosphonate transport system substrate-binding protein